MPGPCTVASTPGQEPMHSYDIGTEPGVVPEVLQLGRLPVTVVGEVAGEAHGGIGHGALCCLAGRSTLPLGPGGRWTPWHAERPPAESGGANEVGHRSRPPTHGSARVPGWLVECLPLGSGMPAPSGQIPPPWAWWENEAPTTRAVCRLVPGSSRTTVGGPAARCAARPCSSPWRRRLRPGGDRSCPACWRSRRCGCRRPWRSGCRGGGARGGAGWRGGVG